MHYFRVSAAADVEPAVARLRRDFVVGLTEDMAGFVDVISRFVLEPSQRAAMVVRMKEQLQWRLRANSNASYCDASSLGQTVLADVAKLAGHDVAFYAGARAVYAEHAELSTPLPLARFDSAYTSARECREAIKEEQWATTAPVTSGGRRHEGHGQGFLRVGLGVGLVGGCLVVLATALMRPVEAFRVRQIVSDADESG